MKGSRTTRGTRTFAGASSVAASVGDLLDAAPLGAFHRRAVLVSGVGFFTDAYDLFVISTVAVIVQAQWHLGTTETSWLAGSAILGAFVGALVFGRLADLFGRRRIYAVVAAIMVLGALLSAIAPSLLSLVAARFVLGLGVGGDYPVSAVLMSEYANRNDRGRLVGMVFSMQALGLVVGPLVALGLLECHLGGDLTWRLLLGLGAVPAGAAIYLRTRMPESPRYQALVSGRRAEALAGVAVLAGEALPDAGPALAGSRPDPVPRRLSLLEVLRTPRLVRLIVATCGCWFVFDYAYYGNTLSLPAILHGVDPHADLVAKLAWSLAMFVVFAVPGYALAVWRMDRVGHRRLQLIGFGVLGVCFLLLATVPVLTSSIAAFVAVFGLSYFFVEFGPNMTTFVLPSEVFPVSARTTGHGTAAGLGKLGAFAGVFLVPALESRIGLRGMLGVAAGAAMVGVVLTRLLPEPAGRGLEEVAAGAWTRAESADAAGGPGTLSGRDPDRDDEPTIAELPTLPDVAGRSRSAMAGRRGGEVACVALPASGYCGAGGPASLTPSSR